MRARPSPSASCRAPHEAASKVCTKTLQRVRLCAPPVDGKANDELARLLARLLCVAARDVEIVVGHSSRTKTVRVAGVSCEAVARRFVTTKQSGRLSRPKSR